MKRVLQKTKNGIIKASREVNEKWKKVKISSKLTMMYSTMVFFTMFIFAVLAIVTVLVYIKIDNNAIIKSTANAVVNSIETKADLNDEAWKNFSFQKDIYIIIYCEDDVYYKSDGISGKFIKELNTSKIDKIMRTEEEGHARYINKRIELDDSNVYIVQIIKTMKSEYTLLWVSFIVISVLLVLGVGASILIGYFMNRRVLGPISAMTKDSLRKQTQFISDASHELKTPITVILAHAEMLKKWAKDDKTALDKSIDNIEKEALNMAELTERLLILAKSDAKTLKTKCEPFDLDELINDIAEETKLLACKKKIIVGTNEKLNVNSDRQSLKELLRIILDNSIKYTNENGVIRLDSKVTDNSLIISVHDNGIGIRTEDLEKIFDRFYCADSSRNKKKSGNGLGLSIARILASELGFEIKVESQEGAWSKFTLSKNL